MALFSANVDLQLARGNNDAARTWLDIWQSITPDHSEIKRKRLLLDLPGDLTSLFRRRK